MQLTELTGINSESVHPDKRQAVIIGAGPAGLTAALELLRRTDIVPVVLEKSHAMGGISRTVNYKGNRMDIGGHRFFSKSDRVMNWWLDILPLESTGEASHFISYHNQHRELSSTAAGADPEKEDRVMLIRNRKSRIYFLRKFFEYPISLSPATLRNLGPVRTAKIGASYAKSAMFQIKPETSLEHFLINRFGRQLYLTFFKSYTEKVWGVPCNEISAEWGAQRIKGLSIYKAVVHMLKKLRGTPKSIDQKDTETSLIEKFLYPKFGPGQLWDTVAEKIVRQGGSIRTGYSVDKILTSGDKVTGVEAIDENGKRHAFRADYVFSTMPIKELTSSLDAAVPENVRSVSDGLIYRDFITVGMLLKKLKIGNEEGGLKDNWIYVQEPDVLVGRIQIFNNWSPYMVADPKTTWVGLEYFCNDTDEIWRQPDSKMIELAAVEMERIGMISRNDVLDATVIRVPKTYPAYFGAYDRFGEIRDYFDRFDNLFLVGRNGMHKYNNQDHSMLTAMTAVDNISSGRTDKSNIWAVNTEQDYHEAKEEVKEEAAAK
jgi:protoporphyrinogen oxidase